MEGARVASACGSFLGFTRQCVTNPTLAEFLFAGKHIINDGQINANYSLMNNQEKRSC